MFVCVCDMIRDRVAMETTFCVLFGIQSILGGGGGGGGGRENDV